MHQIIDSNMDAAISELTYRRCSEFTFREFKMGDRLFLEKVTSTRKDLDPRKDFFVSYLSNKLKYENVPTKKLTYVDLFCGGGGMSLGVQNAAKFFGFKPRLACAVDTDANALKIVEHHFKPLLSRVKSV